MTDLIQPFILYGGSGTWLWPLSRSGFPQQFLCLTGSESLFQQAAKRVVSMDLADQPVVEPIIVTGEECHLVEKAPSPCRALGCVNGTAEVTCGDHLV